MDLHLAFALLERVRARHDPVLTAIEHDPAFRSVRADRRHAALPGTMNLPAR